MFWIDLAGDHSQTTHRQTLRIGKSVSQRLHRPTRTRYKHQKRASKDHPRTLRERFSTASGRGESEPQVSRALRLWKAEPASAGQTRASRRVIATQYTRRSPAHSTRPVGCEKDSDHPGELDGSGVLHLTRETPPDRTGLTDEEKTNSADELNSGIEQHSVRVIDLKFSVDTLQIRGIQVRVDVHPRGSWGRAALCQHPLHSSRGVIRADCFDGPGGASRAVTL